jgi:hypothetical protein
LEHGEERDSTSITVNSDISITATSPAGEGVADVVVVGPGGSSAKNPNDRFGFGPIVDQMTPNRGPAAGGTSVTLGGFGLEGATAVNFGPHPAASFSENPDGSITAVSSPVTADETDVDVRVTTPEGPSLTYTIPDALPTNLFTYGPTVTGVSPNQGPVVGGSLVTIRGTGFRESHYRCFCGPFVQAVYFGHATLECGSPFASQICAPVEFTVNSDEEITAVAPPGMGTEDVLVKTAGGTSPIAPGDQFIYQSGRPAIASEFAVDITSSAATLAALVNPSGLATTYQFEIANAPNCDPKPESGPTAPCRYLEIGRIPSGTLPANFEAQPVSLNLASNEIALQPNATYDFRVVASNAAGEVQGKSEQFTTLPLSSLEGGYRACLTRARAAFRSARSAAKQKHGKPRTRAMHRAKKQHRKAASACKMRFHSG